MKIDCAEQFLWPFFSHSTEIDTPPKFPVSPAIEELTCATQVAKMVQQELNGRTLPRENFGYSNIALSNKHHYVTL